MSNQAAPKRPFWQAAEKRTEPFMSPVIDDNEGYFNQKLSMSPFRLLAVLTVTVFIVELAIMVGIEFVIAPEASSLFNAVEAIFDATVLTIIVFPMLYYFSFRPLVIYIHDHQRIEEELKGAYALLEKTFTSLSDIVLVLDMPDRKIITCNQAAPHVLGYEIDELVGTTIENLFKEDVDYHSFIDRLMERFSSGRFAYHQEWPLLVWR